ncbi:hypothetical protein [Flammeovirga aprica]|uniref:Uncharacterized protein n=1 Tax=Flammeovirga aprica JL-4 TaxID=694437 RepID=A0A7X9P2G7_9BACT|nr:hypothetical protein [Flammeovirga aprica]NME68349.1 hypothetical protein [Flammeovirga aprica JL-4]
MNINKKYIFEFFSILSGVAVALVINTFWSDHEHRQLAVKASNQLYLEIGENLKEVDSMYSIHQDLSQKIDHFLLELEKKEKDPSYAPEQLDEINLNFPLLSNTAWETAKISNAVTFIDFEQISKFNLVYKLQDLHLHTVESFLEHSFTEMQLLGKKEKLIQMRSFIDNILTNEFELITKYQQILDEKNK